MALIEQPLRKAARRLRGVAVARPLISALDLVRLRINPFAPFLDDESMRLDAARQDHLATLGLDFKGLDVLEVGAGIGLHTGYFERRGANVLSTDARPENIREITRRHPNRRVRVLDLESTPSLKHLGHFDVVYCYGTLYHVSQPEQILRALSEVSSMILLETCVTPGDNVAVNLVNEPSSVRTQAKSGTGCRPTRPWILETLRVLWGHAYVSKTQPAHPQFPIDWSAHEPRVNAAQFTRAVFVACGHPLENHQLLEVLPDQQDAPLPPTGQEP